MPLSAQAPLGAAGLIPAVSSTFGASTRPPSSSQGKRSFQSLDGMSWQRNIPLMWMSPSFPDDPLTKRGVAAILIWEGKTFVIGMVQGSSPSNWLRSAVRVCSAIGKHGRKLELKRFCSLIANPSPQILPKVTEGLWESKRHVFFYYTQQLLF